jgi:hypothetical protein
MARFLVVSILLLSIPGFSSAANQQTSPRARQQAILGYSAPQSQPASPFFIVPGASIGPVSIGMPLGEVLKLFGDVAPNIAIPGFPRYMWTQLPDNRLAGLFVVSGAAAVDAISVSFDTRYMTSAGIHIGDPSTSVRWSMGPPATVTTGLYDADIWFYPGIAFTIGNSKSKQCERHVCGIGVGRGFAEVF